MRYRSERHESGRKVFPKHVSRLITYQIEYEKLMDAVALCTVVENNNKFLAFGSSSRSY